ncbi:MAG: hypothetical protein K8F91_23280 [Candidatus Obscuribacterales bacterium]|nr:hypothetical protein [Candidatus Obscuribacterales bacterium]
MLAIAPKPTHSQARENAEIVGMSESGDWNLNLPVELSAYEGELLSILGKVFVSCPQSLDDLALAEQLSLNWCTAKCRQLDLQAEAIFDL